MKWIARRILSEPRDGCVRITCYGKCL